jgi:hypothetical protein
MNAVTEFTLEDHVDLILPSQYDDLVRRRSPLNDGEGRLLWAVLEEAIRTYRASRKCSTPIQREKFQEVCSWFEPSEAQERSGLSFQTICEFLGIDPGQLLERLKSLDDGEFSAPALSAPAQWATANSRRLIAPAKSIPTKVILLRCNQSLVGQNTCEHCVSPPAEPNSYGKQQSPGV